MRNLKFKILFLIICSFQVHASTIVFIGDSHSVGPFGWYFDENLRKDGHVVATYASCGSIAAWWFSGKSTNCGYFSRDIRGQKFQTQNHFTPLILNVLSEVKPEIIVMEFGGNYLPMPGEISIRKDIRKIVDAVEGLGIKCFWITHPDSRKLRNEILRVSEIIKSEVGEACNVFESHKVTTYPSQGGDGTHYWFPAGLPLAQIWADKAYSDFKLMLIEN